MQLRSRTASNSNLRDGQRSRNISHGSIDSDYSSPVLQDVGNLAPEQPAQQAEQVQLSMKLRLPEKENHRNSGSSSGLSGMSEFLAKYKSSEETGSDDDTVDENALQFESSEVDAQRRKQELEEHNSAVLSKRAEDILANAKKRLNVMEGNLRGARDLVAPLTAANLKRATSLGSAHTHYSQGASYNSRVRYIPQPQHSNRPDPNADREQPLAYRTLHSQASTPALGRQYQHTRNFSDINLPDRPFTSLDQHRSRTPVQPRSTTPSRAQTTESPSHTPGLRGRRSYDSLGMGSRDRPLHTPDANHLEALPEDDEVIRHEANWRAAVKQPYRHQTSFSQDTNHGVDSYRSSSRSSSRTSDLREQMSNLKGRISTLKDRAREDSLRRQSQANLRETETTPFNNAQSAAPELFYSLEHAKANEDGKTSPEGAHKPHAWLATGSRNAFADKKNYIQCARVVEIPASQRKAKVREVRTTPSPPQETVRKRSGTAMETGHHRTPSGTAIVRAAERRYSHHQLSSSLNPMPGTFLDDADVEDVLAAPPSPPHSNGDFSSSPLLPDMSGNGNSRTNTNIDDDYAPSESDAGDSIYEDALEFEGEAIVPHEHREDAFDYETFFLTGAMARYSRQRRRSEASTGSMSSTETAKGPAAPADEGEVVDGYSSDPGVGAKFPPATPRTPERLRAIERNLAGKNLPIRPLSEESVSTLNSYATARENGSSEDHDDGSPPVSPISEALNRFSTSMIVPGRPVSPLSDAGRSPPMPVDHDFFASSGAESKKRSPMIDSARQSPWLNHEMSPDLKGHDRPTPADKMRRSSSSDRADSGIGSETKCSAGEPHQNSISHRHGQPSRDLTAVAVEALLDPRGIGLGLRDNAVLFGVVESLRHVVREMQRHEQESDGQDGTSREMRMLMMRRRLERARGALDGGFGGA